MQGDSHLVIVGCLAQEDCNTWLGVAWGLNQQPDRRPALPPELLLSLTRCSVVCVLVCGAPGEDGGLRERGDSGVPLLGGRELPLPGAEPPPSGGAPLHRDDRRRQLAGRPAPGRPCLTRCLSLSLSVLILHGDTSTPRSVNPETDQRDFNQPTNRVVIHQNSLDPEPVLDCWMQLLKMG